MTRAVSSLYTSFLDAPPAACVSVPFHGSSDICDEATNSAASLITNSGNDGGDDGGSGGGGSAGSLLVTGTYTLDKDTQLRTGSLVLHEVLMKDKQDGIELKHHRTELLPSGSVLDIRLLKASASPSFPSGCKLLVATSTGQISVYSVSRRSLKFLSTHEVTDSTTLILSLSISPDGLLVSTTTSDSKIHIHKFTDTTLTSLKQIAEIENVHTGLEAWASIFSIDGKTLYSGGDDGSFAAWDLGALNNSEDMGDDEEQTPVQTYRNRKIHTAGVTSILPVTISGQEYIITGSYDQFVRIFSPSTKRWLDTSIDLEGGVWRLEILSNNNFIQKEQGISSDKDAEIYILASCMHAGCCILSAELKEGGEIILTPIATMKEHESMNYASACIGNNEPMFISTSFYDRRVCCWRL
ncbi:hypothetical protein TWF106_007388 [Orbilia oligospora]|uniref:methylated diphthine methylhydrolase n=1 Tax=Orbilia oligospora TaxID=2813651 RepID=A0A6G1MCQ7_ORBOL|nr:hypothetical protein TWF106_007388 [Orbilia oligospora]KAF3228563.1 hypothetical protein TWF191_002419 [Orbilia oligospora]KAF3252929.1 hypothetical protein TWF192_004214 [Orbilia oligospora]